MPLISRLLAVGAACLMLSSASIAAPRATAKGKPSSANDKFTFVAYGDTRTYQDDHAKVIAAILRLHPEFVLQSGDLVGRGTDPIEWGEFAKVTQPLRDNHIAYYPARGNHDAGSLFLQWVPKPIESGTGNYYAFTRHNSRFIMLDSMDDGHYAPDSAQYKWFVEELQKAQKTAANIFVVFHEGPYSVGPHGPIKDAAKYLVPLFIKYHVRAVINGHDHLYYRTIRNGIGYFVTGGGGAPLYQPTNAAKVAIPGDVYASVHHIILYQVDGSRVTCTAIALDKDPTFTTPWHQTQLNPRVIKMTKNGPRDTIIAAKAGGTVIDKVTLGP